VYDEINLSYSLLFGQRGKGERTLQGACREVGVTVYMGFHNLAPFIKVSPFANATLNDFNILGRRLEKLHRQVQKWKPRRLRQLLKPESSGVDRFTWCTQMFAITIAIIGLLGLLLSVVQTAYAIKAYDDGLAVALASLNVSLRQLALQRQQMNLTAV
jgi:hypothetical protein